MNDVVYDVPIGEAAKILEKSDRQVRRYVKEKRLLARSVRVDGHIKLMFNRDELEAYKERLAQGEYFGDTGREIIADTRLIDEGNGSSTEDADFTVLEGTESGQTDTVKYVIDALREQIRDLRKENQDLHYQLEQRSGQVGFLQGKIEVLQEEVKMLMPASPAESETAEKKAWYRRIFRRN